MTTRERPLNWRGIDSGIAGEKQLRVYASPKTYPSIDKAVWIAGIVQQYLVKTPTDSSQALDPEAPRRAIDLDLAAGRPGWRPPVPVYRMPLPHQRGVAGSEMICPELHELWQGVEEVESTALNPHKRLGAQFDCSIYFLADPKPQVRTLGMRPVYLQSPQSV